MSIVTVWGGEPSIAVEDQNVPCQRYQVGGLWVDATSEPTQDEVDAVLGKTPKALTLAQISSLETEQIARTTARARREMDLGSILAIRAIGSIFQTLGTALNQAAVVNAALPLVRIGKVEDKANPGTWIDAPGVKALIDIQTAVEQKRAQL